MQKAIVTIHDPSGLHARPSGRIAKEATRFLCEITMRDTNGGKPVNAKSTLHILTGKFTYGARVELICDGKDEAEALDAVRSLIEGLTE